MAVCVCTLAVFSMLGIMLILLRGNWPRQPVWCCVLVSRVPVLSGVPRCCSRYRAWCVVLIHRSGVRLSEHRCSGMFAMNRNTGRLSTRELQLREISLHDQARAAYERGDMQGCLLKIRAAASVGRRLNRRLGLAPGALLPCIGKANH
jgi:hypothetical protein